ncbi:hypothetical protein H2199_003965 [Coniosporium tulheliwenetii]|uniref:Uncharacterized protein n=1 Tax=Coniosporium tulheliwenetii TaxID=3383036 RepID=A0ACC2Z8K2_9PEZI|nr:hypothetical protein H2199_003965 [Cladosporium sp. JES 115]
MYPFREVYNEHEEEQFEKYELRGWPRESYTFERELIDARTLGDNHTWVIAFPGSKSEEVFEDGGTRFAVGEAEMGQEWVVPEGVVSALSVSELISDVALWMEHNTQEVALVMVSG